MRMRIRMRVRVRVRSLSAVVWAGDCGGFLLRGVED